MATPPTAPDPYALTNQQTQINQQNATWNAAANAGNTTTPVGSSTFTSRIDPATGATIWDQNISLAPDQQALLTQQNQQDLSLAPTGAALAGQVASTLSNPLDMSGLPALTSSVDTSGLPKLYGADDLLGARQQTQDALYQRSASYLDPQYQQREMQFQQRAASQGLVEGSEAWRQARDQFMRERAFDYDTARTSAITGGLNEMQGLSGIASGNRAQLFGEGTTNANLGNSARSQALSELLTARAQPLNEYNALRDATKVTMPTFPGKAPVTAQAADLSGNVNQNFQNQADLYNAQQTTQNAQREGLVGLAGNLLNSPLGQGVVSSVGGWLRDAAGRIIGPAPAGAAPAGVGAGVGSAVGAGVGALGGALGDVLGGASLSSMAGSGAGSAGLTGLTGLGSGTVAANTGGMGAALQAGAGAAPAGTAAAGSGGLGTLGTIGAGLGLAAGAAGAYEGIRTGNEGMAALGGGVAGVSGGLLAGLQGMAALGPVGLAAAGVTALAASMVNTAEFGDVALRNYWSGIDSGRNIGESDPVELAQGFINFYRTNKNNFPGQAVYGRTGNEDFMFDMTQQVNQAVQSGQVPPDATPGQIYEAAIKPWLAQMGPGPTDEKARAVQDFMMTDLINSFMNGQPISNAQVKNDSKFRIVSERPVYAGAAPQQSAQTLAEPLPWNGQQMPDFSQLGLMGGF